MGEARLAVISRVQKKLYINVGLNDESNRKPMSYKLFKSAALN